MNITYGKVIVGDYAAVPVEDPFDSSKTAYWLYKENYSICIYLFSCEGLTNAEIQKRLSGEELAKSIALLETRWRKEDDPLIYENEYKAVCNYIGLCNDNPDLVKLLSSLIGTKYAVDSFDDEIEKVCRKTADEFFFHNYKPQLAHDMIKRRFMRSNYRCRTETMNYFICLKLENDSKYVRIVDGCLEKI